MVLHKMNERKPNQLLGRLFNVFDKKGFDVFCAFWAYLDVNNCLIEIKSAIERRRIRKQTAEYAQPLTRNH